MGIFVASPTKPTKFLRGNFVGYFRGGLTSSRFCISWEFRGHFRELPYRRLEPEHDVGTTDPLTNDTVGDGPVESAPVSL